ncbi:metallophosphoesterase [Thioclava sp. BHET1]|nr:metallophosphoesterase [Thioclava sp. BHET1]
MTRIVHLSDLHFGRTLPALESPLVQNVNALGADLIVISGDFTQRARRGQFSQARRFVESLDAPVLSVPGNHDTPLDNIFVRFLRPFGRYKAAIDRNLEPDFDTDDLRAVGVNTVNRFAWQRGKVSGHTVARLCEGFSDAQDKLCVAVMHHPLEHGPDVDKKLMGGADRALEGLNECGADLVLSGHLHTASAAPFSAVPGVLFVQAGTGLSSRLRGERNMFNLIEGDARALSITRFEADESTRFVPRAPLHFTRVDGHWQSH